MPLTITIVGVLIFWGLIIMWYLTSPLRLTTHRAKPSEVQASEEVKDKLDSLVELSLSVQREVYARRRLLEAKVELMRRRQLQPPPKK